MANDIKLQEGHPVDENLRPLKVGGKATAIETAQHGNGARVTGDLEVTGNITTVRTGHMITDDGLNIYTNGKDINIYDDVREKIFIFDTASSILKIIDDTDNPDDYFSIDVNNHGATTIATFDEATNSDADLIFDLEGEMAIKVKQTVTIHMNDVETFNFSKISSGGTDYSMLSCSPLRTLELQGGAILFDSAGDITLDAAGGNIYFKDNNVTYIDFQVDGTNDKMVVTGALTIDTSGNFTIDAAGGIYMDTANGACRVESGGSTYTPTHATDLVTKAYADSHYHFIRVGFDYSLAAGTKVFLPMAGAEQQREGSTQFGLSEQYVFLCPFDGSLETIWARSEEVCGSTAIGFHLTASALETPSATATQTVTVDMSVDDTSYEFDFASAGTNTFSQGNIIMFSFDPTNDANDTHCMIVLKFDVST